MWNSITSGLGMFAAKQQLNGILGDDNNGDDKTDTAKTDKMRADLEEKRKGRGDDYAARMAERKANKGKISEMWAENKKKNKS